MLFLSESNFSQICFFICFSLLSFVRRNDKAFFNSLVSFKATATTLREVHTASNNDWAALAWHDGEFHNSVNRDHLEIFDRVGGGDSFASGLIYGFLEYNDAAQAVEWGAAHGALAMTTPGDTTMVTRDEVAKLVGGGSARVDR